METIYKKVKLPENVENELDRIVTESNMDYLDAILYWCEKNNINADLFSSNSIPITLKQKLIYDAKKKKLLKDNTITPKIEELI